MERKIILKVQTVYNTGTIEIIAKGGDMVKMILHNGIEHTVDGRELAENLLFAVNNSGDKKLDMFYSMK